MIKSELYRPSRFAVFVVAVIAALTFAVPAVSAKVYAVCVGVNKYIAHGQNQLHFAVSDAQSMARFFKNNSDAVVVTVTDRQATRANVLRTANQVFSKAGPDDVVVFYFSGHGLPGAMCVHDTQTPATLLTYKDLGSVMKRSRARNKLIFSDTCHAGSGRIAKTNARPEDLNGMNILLFLSSRGNEISRETSQGGLFTVCLLKGLEGAADKNRDRAITARELFDYVSTRVANLSRGRQHPVMWGKFNPNLNLMTY